jgi:hypothetical protein
MVNDIQDTTTLSDQHKLRSLSIPLVDGYDTNGLRYLRPFLLAAARRFFAAGFSSSSSSSSASLSPSPSSASSSSSSSSSSLAFFAPLLVLLLALLLAFDFDFAFALLLLFALDLLLASAFDDADIDDAACYWMNT